MSKKLEKFPSRTSAEEGGDIVYASLAVSHSLSHLVGRLIRFHLAGWLLFWPYLADMFASGSIPNTEPK